MKIKDAFEGYLKYRKEMGMQPITMANDRKCCTGRLRTQFPSARLCPSK